MRSKVSMCNGGTGNSWALNEICLPREKPNLDKNARNWRFFFLA